jgi:hypothetical protein
MPPVICTGGPLPLPGVQRSGYTFVHYARGYTGALMTSAVLVRGLMKTPPHGLSAEE